MKITSVLFACFLFTFCNQSASPVAPEIPDSSISSLSIIQENSLTTTCVAEPMDNYPITQNSWLIESGALKERTFFAQEVGAGDHAATADVVWSLSNCRAATNPHRMRRLRIYLNDTLIRESITDGLENQQTFQQVNANFSGSGCLRITASQVTICTAAEKRKNYSTTIWMMKQEGTGVN